MAKDSIKAIKTRTVKNPVERRTEIVAAARTLFQTKDYDTTTMQDVMHALGVAKGTIYHYFSSKEALLDAVIEHIIDTNLEHMQSIVQTSSSSALDKIKMLVAAGNISGQNEDLLNTLHKPGNSAMHTRLLVASITKQAPLYAQAINQGCREGIFKTDTPLECAEFILAGVQFLTDMGVHAWSEQDIKRRAQAFPAIIQALLHAPAGSFDFLINQISKH